MPFWQVVGAVGGYGLWALGRLCLVLKMGYNDYGYGIEVGSEGSVFVAGHSKIHAVPFVVKYSDDGSLLWKTDIQTPYSESFSDLVSDGQGGVFVGGGSQGGPDCIGGWDMILSRINSAGARRWFSRFGSTESEGPYDIAIDGPNIYTSGYTFGVLGERHLGEQDAILVKIVVPEPSTYSLLVTAVLFIWAGMWPRGRN